MSITLARPAPPSPSTGPVDQGMVVQSAWQDQALWSATADRLKQRLDFWRRASAVGGVAGLALSVQAAGMADGNARTVLAGLAALLLAVVPYVQKTKVTPAQLAAWTRARAASEGLKEAIYRFLMGVPPADPPGATEGNGTAAPDPASAAALVRRCQAIKGRVADLQSLAAEAPRPDAARPMPSQLDAAGYLDRRVNGQIRWYGDKANALARRARKLRGIEFALGLLAVLMGAMSGGDALKDLAALAALVGASGLAVWTGVVTTAGAAITTHLAATRIEELANVYFATADRLRGLRDEWLTDEQRDTPERTGGFVDAIERALSTENQGWLADWGKGPAG